MLFSQVITVEILKVVSPTYLRRYGISILDYANDVFVHHILSEIVMATHECESKTRRSLSVAVEVIFTAAAVQRWSFDAPTINNGWCPIHWQKQSYLHVQPIWIKLQQIIFFIS